MINQLISSIPDVSTYQVLALLIFFPMFVGITIWVFKGKKTYMKQMSALPLNDGTSVDQKSGE